MVKPRFRINIFDIISIVVAMILIGTIIFGWNNKPYLGSHIVDVKIKIDNRDTINAVLQKVHDNNNKIVFYSGSKYPVIQALYDLVYGSDKEASVLNIVLKGYGDISDNGSIFNGQRVYINQKVEIRSDYFVQGYVTDFHYAN